MKIFFLFAFIFLCQSIFGQKLDEIVKKDNSRIKGKIIDIKDEYIEFDPEGDIPFIIINKTNVSAIIYSDGRVEIMDKMPLTPSKIFLNGQKFDIETSVITTEEYREDIMSKTNSRFDRKFYTSYFSKFYKSNLRFEDDNGISEEYVLDLDPKSFDINQANISGDKQTIKNFRCSVTFVNSKNEILFEKDVEFSGPYIITTKGLIEKGNSIDLGNGYELIPAFTAQVKYGIDFIPFFYITLWANLEKGEGK